MILEELKQLHENAKELNENCKEINVELTSLKIVIAVYKNNNGILKRVHDCENSIKNLNKLKTQIITTIAIIQGIAGFVFDCRISEEENNWINKSMENKVEEILERVGEWNLRNMIGTKIFFWKRKIKTKFSR